MTCQPFGPTSQGSELGQSYYFVFVNEELKSLPKNCLHYSAHFVPAGLPSAQSRRMCHYNPSRWFVVLILLLVFLLHRCHPYPTTRQQKKKLTITS